MIKIKKLAVVGKECVACGSCVKVCPRNAMHIAFGYSAKVDSEKCIGCGKCVKICPAAVISLCEREVEV